MKIYFMKMMSGVTTALGSAVPSFHKKISGIKSKFNVPYVEGGNKKEFLDVFYPKNAKTRRSKSVKKRSFPTIIYFHGGGWACYDKKLYITLMRRLASLGFVVFSCNYSLAPKFKLDKIMDDARSAFNYIIDYGRDYGANIKSIVIGGDSAGAHISSELTAEFIEESNPNLRLIKALLLFYGVYDLTTVTDTGFTNIKAYVDSCVSGGMDNQPELEKWSPIFKDLSKFPPTLLASGEVDKLHKSQSARFARSLSARGVVTKRVFFAKDENKAMHAFMNFDGLPTTEKVLDEINIFLNDRLSLNGKKTDAERVKN